jgi:hypothetical protein
MEKILRKFKVGDMVLVSDNLNKTYELHGKSPSGFMERMKGKIFPIKKVISQPSYLIFNKENSFSYTFHWYDLYHSEVKEPDPVIFKYNTKYLDI